MGDLVVSSFARNRIRHGRGLVGCVNLDCPCHDAGVVCDEWMGYWGDDFCPRCGWNRAAHPKGFDPTNSSLVGPSRDGAPE